MYKLACINIYPLPFELGFYFMNPHKIVHYIQVWEICSFNLGKLTKLRFLKKITLFCPLVEQQSIFSSITVHGMILFIIIIILNTDPKTI